MNNKLDVGEMQNLWNKYYKVFVSEVHFQLIFAPKKKVPWLLCSPKNGTYTDHYKINIGLKDIYDIFEPKTEEEFLIYTLYLIGHEVGHIKRTPNKPWVWGINAGVKEICKIASEHYEGKGKRRFVKTTDIQTFLKYMSDTHDINIHKRDLEKFCHGIQNSLEDGREERIEAKHDAAFKTRMKVCRGLFWDKQPINVKIAAAYLQDADISSKLYLISSQILSLSTTSLYQKNWFDLFDDDAEINENIENNILPLIAKAVTANSCDECMHIAVEIEKLLAVDLFEAAKANKISSSSGQNSANGTSSDTESSSDTETSSDTEGSSDNDDVHSDNEKSDLKDLIDKIMDSSGMPYNGEEEHDGLERNEIKEDESDNIPDASIFGGDLTGHMPVSQNNQSSNQNMPKGNLKQNSGYQNTGDTNSNVNDKEAIKKAIEDAMSEAASRCAGLIENADTDNKSKQILNNDKAFSPVVPDIDIKKQYPEVDFEKLCRKYTVDLPMPAGLQYRADVFKRKIEEILKSQIKRSYDLKRGDLDSDSIYKLLLGDLNIFSNENEPDIFDGACYILQDNSGSMGYGSCSKREYACEATAIAEYAFTNLMPLKIVAFDADGDDFVTHEVIKNFDEMSSKSCSYNFLLKGRDGDCNKDGYSIRVATGELLKRKEQNKLLLVLSDGTPSAYSNYANGLKDVADAVEEAKKAGINVVSIYFSESPTNEEIDAYKQMYGNSTIITTPEHIETEMLSLIKTFYFK